MGTEQREPPLHLLAREEKRKPTRTRQVLPLTSHGTKQRSPEGAGDFTLQPQKVLSNESSCCMFLEMCAMHCQSDLMGSREDTDKALVTGVKH